MSEFIVRKEYAMSGSLNATLVERFSRKKDLWVSDSFTSRVLPFHDDNGTSDISNCDSVSLSHSMFNIEIIKKYLGGMEEAKKNAFTLNQVWAFIESQKNGTLGRMPTNIEDNAFHCLGKDNRLFAVNVRLYSGRKVCSVNVWKLDEDGLWDIGRRVFRNRRQGFIP
jgi:hypothetical protein